MRKRYPIRDLLARPVARAALLDSMGSFLRAIRDDEPHIIEDRALSEYDWEAPHTDEELLARVVRTPGDMVCPICGKPYRKHPKETRLLDWEGRPWLERICTGILAKL